MKKYKYLIYTFYTAGFQFAVQALNRGNEVKLVSHKDNSFNSLYESKFRDNIFYFDEITDIQLYEEIKNYSPDFLVSLVFNKKIPNNHITAANIIAVNIHPSRLPEIRTGDSSFWNILLETSFFEITMHRLTESWDAGDIIFRDKVSLSPFETRLSLIKKVEKYMIKNSEKFQKVLEEGKYSFQPQAQGKYYPKLKTRSINLTLLENPLHLEKLIRATNADIHIQALYKETLLCLVEIDVMHLPSSLSPGTLQIENNLIYLHTKSNLIKINILYTDDYGYLSDTRFIRVYVPKTGDKLLPIKGEPNNEILNDWVHYF